MTERPKIFTPKDEEKRRNYKYAMLQPYFHLLPRSVVDTMLDNDLHQTDDLGEQDESVYEIRLETGEVDRVINETKLPFH